MMNDDLEVIERVRSGRAEDFRVLVERYERPVFRFLAGLLADEHQRQDAAQEVFLTVFRRLDSFDPGKGQFSTWLFTVARNVGLNAIRKKAPMPVAHVPDREDVDSPVDRAAGRELFEQLDLQLEQLPAQEKTVFVLAELTGLSHEEIARVEHIEPGTVRSRLCRAKQKLRKLLRRFNEV